MPNGVPSVPNPEPYINDLGDWVLVVLLLMLIAGVVWFVKFGFPRFLQSIETIASDARIERTQILAEARQERAAAMEAFRAETTLIRQAHAETAKVMFAKLDAVELAVARCDISPRNNGHKPKE